MIHQFPIPLPEVASASVAYVPRGENVIGIIDIELLDGRHIMGVTFADQVAARDLCNAAIKSPEVCAYLSGIGGKPAWAPAGMPAVWTGQKRPGPSRTGHAGPCCASCATDRPCEDDCPDHE